VGQSSLVCFYRRHSACLSSTGVIGRTAACRWNPWPCPTSHHRTEQKLTRPLLTFLVESDENSLKIEVDRRKRYLTIDRGIGGMISGCQCDGGERTRWDGGMAQSELIHRWASHQPLELLGDGCSDPCMLSSGARIRSRLARREKLTYSEDRISAFDFSLAKHIPQ